MIQFASLRLLICYYLLCIVHLYLHFAQVSRVFVWRKGAVHYYSSVYSFTGPGLDVWTPGTEQRAASVALQIVHNVSLQT